MAQNLQKKPSKGILKTSRSVDGQEGMPSTSKRPKEQRFDEMNIMETFHPPNKDYGHMKVDEPKTPYSEAMDSDMETNDELDANILAAKLAASMNKPPKCVEMSDNEEDEPEDARQRRLEFEKKRKMHYNEFQALQLARQLLAQEEEDDAERDQATST
ncbi:protein phosphatase inhibitor 2 [Pieris rapae]|uniref:protein phosphatase inhibitor 2 n=1 Tax=Pieris rapae TaxID=64459 RepID=UPI000B92666C|nr:protein phosphatase inhibitor 2 [Pieris rapae]XP_022116030.1 protein phosphatase inhibitor 2 [Pieris rapae]XP_022116031.1 protein phosphatase inhibitor 2 [Pieris rapae]